MAFSPPAGPITLVHPEPPLVDRDVTPIELGVVAVGGLLAGAANAVAGGGTLVSFPALLAAGLPPFTANVTSSTGLLAGFVGGSFAYRRELAGQGRRVRSLGLTALAGGTAGAVLLLRTPGDAFEVVVPWLVLVACALLAVQPRLTSLVAARRERRGRPDSRASGWPLHLGLGLGAVYGSYFGAGFSVILLALLGILLDDRLHRLNALKGVLALTVNLIGVALFVASGAVDLVAAAVLAVAALVGGTVGVTLARRLPPAALRAGIVALGVAVAAALLVRG